MGGSKRSGESLAKMAGHQGIPVGMAEGVVMPILSSLTRKTFIGGVIGRLFDIVKLEQAG